MRPPGIYKLSYRNRGPFGAAEGPSRGAFGARDGLLSGVLPGQRTQRILDSLRREILEGGSANVRIRRVFASPVEVFRLELELPDLGYQRVTLLDRDALEDLLATDDVRAVVQQAVVDG